MMHLNLSLLLPESVLLGVFVIMMVAEILRGKVASTVQENKWIEFCWFVGACLVALSVLPYADKIGVAFGGSFLVDSFASFFKVFFSLVFIAVFLISREYFKGNLTRTSEFYLILWCILIGLFFLVSANDFLLLFVSLEIVTLSFYVLASYLKRELLAIEAGLKYFILGSLASAFIVFGIALIYFACGATSLPSVQLFFADHSDNPFLRLGILLILSGLGFKVASVPFQLWVPDVYQGAPTPVVSFLAVGSKAAGFAILMRLLFTVWAPFEPSRILLFSALACMTLVYGNFAALLQTNIKRLFGYSSIGHAGYLLIGLAVGKMAGSSAILYYLIAYAVTNLAAFSVITLVGNALKSDEISAFRGLAKRAPFLAGVFFIALLSLAGVPPLAGFFGKFLILLAAVESNLKGLALLGALSVAVSLYYYLSIVRTMYVDDPSDSETITISRSMKSLLVILSALILVIGVWQKPFLDLCLKAVLSLF